MVTPFRFRAVTSRPRGKCRSIFLTGGVVSIFLSASLSSRVAGEVLSFLCKVVQRGISKWWSLTGGSKSLQQYAGRRYGEKGFRSYQLSFWVSLATCISMPSFSATSLSVSLDYRVDLTTTAHFGVPYCSLANEDASGANGGLLATHLGLQCSSHQVHSRSFAAWPAHSWCL
jgi:hypothetical protein